MLKSVIFIAFATICYGRPNDSIDTQNVVTVPPNCPEGYEWINGQCREIWRQGKNVVSVPPNCDPGQQLINGQCRDVWRSGVSGPLSNEKITKNKCPPGFELLSGLRALCKEWPVPSTVLQYRREHLSQASFSTSGHNVLRRAAAAGEDSQTVVGPVDRNIISVPNQCPSGYRPDAFGICRPVFDV